MSDFDDAVANLITVGCRFLKVRASGRNADGSPTAEAQFWAAVACREFQYYANLRWVASEPLPDPTVKPGTGPTYAERLSQEENKLPLGRNYKPADITDGVTRGVLKSWVDHQYRIPVVISAWAVKLNKKRPPKFTRISPASPRAQSESLWLADDFEQTKCAMFVTDLSVNTFDEADRFRLLGGWHKKRTSGPIELWGEATTNKVNYKDMISTEPGDLGGDPEALRFSNFLVVAAIASVENRGFLDGVNSWDNSIVSLGPCQWTFGPPAKNRKVESGELGAFLTLAGLMTAVDDGGVYDELIRKHDLQPQYLWETPSDAKVLFNPSKHTYECKIFEYVAPPPPLRFS